MKRSFQIPSPRAGASFRLRPGRAISVVLLLAGVAAAAVPGCGSAKDPLLAKIGPREIRASNFVDAWTAVKVTDRPDLSTLDARKSFLQDLVNKNLMELAATDKYPDLTLQQQWRFKRFRDTQTNNLFRRKLVRDQIAITKEMKDQLYENMKRQLHLQGILVADPGEAQFIQKQLEEGGDFTKLAKTYSAQWVSEGDPNAGDMGWVKAGTLTWGLDKEIWAAKTGQVVGPYRTPRGIYFVKVLGERPYDPGASREALNGTLTDALMQPLYMDRQAAVLDSVNQAEAPYVPASAKALLMKKYYWEPPADQRDNPYVKFDSPRVRPTFTAEEETTKVVLFKDAPAWTAKEFADRLDWYPPGIWPSGQSEEEMNQVLQIMTRDYLIGKAAEDLKLTDDPEFQKLLESRKKEMRVTYFYYNDILPKATPSDDQVKAYYNENKNNYKAPPSYKVAYFSAKSRELVDRIAQDWKSGMSFNQIQAKYAGQDSLDSSGETPWIYETQDAVLDGTVKPLKEGGVSDPLTRLDRTTVYKLIARRPERLVGFDEVKEQVQKDAKASFSDQYLDKFLEQERQKYPVTLYEKNLTKVKIPESLPSVETLPS